MLFCAVEADDLQDIFASKTFFVLKYSLKKVLNATKGVFKNYF